MDLTLRQEKALEQLKRLPVPPVPAILKASLVRAPAWVRWAPITAMLLAAAFAGLMFVRLPLTEGGSHWVISEGLQTIHLPLGRTTLILQSPADLQIRRIERRLLSGRLEMDLLLKEGDLFLEADPRAPKQIFIQTPLLQVRLTGTQLLIGHRPAEGSRLVVLRGQVQVKMPNSEWSPLPSGEELTVRSDGTAARRPVQSTFDPAELQVQPHPPAAAGVEDSESGPVNRTRGPLRRMIWHEEGKSIQGESP